MTKPVSSPHNDQAPLYGMAKAEAVLSPVSISHGFQEIPARLATAFFLSKNRPLVHFTHLNPHLCTEDPCIINISTIRGGVNS